MSISPLLDWSLWHILSQRKHCYNYHPLASSWFNYFQAFPSKWMLYGFLKICITALSWNLHLKLGTLVNQHVVIYILHNFWGRRRKSLVCGGKFQGAHNLVCHWQVSKMSKTLFRWVECICSSMNVQQIYKITLDVCYQNQTSDICFQRPIYVSDVWHLFLMSDIPSPCASPSPLALSNVRYFISDVKYRYQDVGLRYPDVG